MRRWVAPLLLALSITTAQGQTYDALYTAVRAAKDHGVIPVPTQGNVTDIKGFPGLKSREGALPEPDKSADQARGLVVVHTDTFTRTGDDVALDGGVELLYKGYHILADKARGNLANEIFNFSGNVKIYGEAGSIKGDSVMAEFKTKFFRALDSDSDIKPVSTKGLLLDDLYVKGKDTHGTRREIFNIDGTATTCNYEEPHYEILAGRSTIRPYRRAIFHDIDLIILHRRVLHLPFLSVPLNEPNYNYLPQVGQSPLEGYFVKSRYGVPLRNDVNNLDARIDYFSKLGGALGGDYRYGMRDQNLLSVYGLPSGPHSFEVSSHHKQDLGKLNVALDNEYQSHNYLIDANSVSLNSRALLTYTRKASTSRLTYSRTGSENVGFSTTNQSIGFNDDRSLTSKFRSSLQVNWSKYDTEIASTSAVSRQQLTVTSDLKDDLARATAELRYQRNIPIGDTSNFFNSSDQTPVLSLTSDARRLFGAKAQSFLPFTTSLSTGQFTDPIRQGHIERTIYDLNFNKADTGQRRSGLSFDGRFRQGIYSDNTAQFVLGVNTNYMYRLGKDTAFHFNYNLLRPEGYAPLSMDRTGRTDQATADVSFRPLRTVLLGAQSGYDFTQLLTQNTAWQSLGVRAEYQPRKNLSIRTLSTYDTYQRGWSNIRADIGYKTGPTFVAFGLRYDAVRETLGNANAYISALRWGRLSADVRIEYNGYLKQFSAQQYGLVYDLHCAEAILQVLDTGYGFNSGRQIIFFIRIKALPFNSLFGTGQRGQPIGTGTGRDF